MMQIRIQYFSIFTVMIIVSLVLVSCSSVPVVRNSLPPSKTKMQLLAERIIENTPEYVHFALGAKFSWVLISPATKSNAPELQNEVITLLKKKYTVYFNADDIPKEYLYHGGKGELIGYRDGFSFGFSAELEKEGIIKVRYWDYEGNEGASDHWTRYKWTGKRWDIIEKSPLTVS
jgi:hypothetical protein